MTSFLKRSGSAARSLKKYTDLYKKHFPNDKLHSLSFYGMSGALHDR